MDNVCTFGMNYWHAYHGDLLSHAKAEKRTPNLAMPNLFWASFRFLAWFLSCSVAGNLTETWQPW